jgi:glycosyltransferase involved in cell wall biosynthesis
LPAPTISVSIVIPMLNEERYIGPCLRSILGNQFPAGGEEILVVDGGSTDRSRDVVNELAATDPRIRLLANPERITPCGLNIGIRQARGKYILRMDAHAEFPSGYVVSCIEELERTGAENVGGVIETRPGAPTLVARAIAEFSRHPLGVGNSAFRLGWGDRFAETVPFGAFRKELFDRIGLFRTDLPRVQDLELNRRIRANGGTIYLSNRIRSTYYRVADLRGFVRRAFWTSFYIPRALIRYRTGSVRHLVPFVFTTTLLALFLAGLWDTRALFAAAAMLAAYLAITTVASILPGARREWSMALILPLLFPLYHFSYGIGTLAGWIPALLPGKTEQIDIIEPDTAAASKRG